MASPITLEDLLPLRQRDLHALLAKGHPIDERALDDREYDGVSLGLPRWLEKLTWKKFTKTFHRDPATGRLRGWNVRDVQTPLSEPWAHKTKHGVPVTWGHYELRPGAGYRMPGPYGAGLMIDYGLGGNAWPTSRTRDPLVAVNEGSVELLLGWSYLDTMLGLWKTPFFFALRRGIPLAHVARSSRAVG